MPQGYQLRELLVDRADHRVLRAERGGRSWIVRSARTARAVAAEVEVFATLTAAGLVPPSEWGTTPDGSFFVVRPFVPGRSFDAAVREARSTAEVLEWVRALLATLETLHAAGFVHRDVCSDNIVVGPGGVFLVDLEWVGDGRDGGVGTPLHIAPEVLLGQRAGPAADLFSVGAMLALAFCGEGSTAFHTRFPREDFWSASGLDPERVPAELRTFVCAAVRRDSADRPTAAAGRLWIAGDSNEPAASLHLPFLLGRGAALESIVDELRQSGAVVVLPLEDAEETEELTTRLQLALLRVGRSPQRCAGSAEGMLAVDDHCDTLLRPLPPGADSAGEIVARVIEATPARSAVVLLPREEWRAVQPTVEQRLTEDERSQLRAIEWLRPSAASVEAHLRRLAGDDRSNAIERLAATLYRRTGGRLSHLRAELAQAVERGVLRATGASYAVLTDEWPQVRKGDVDAPDSVLALSAPALQWLQTLAVLRVHDDPAMQRAAAGLGARELAAATAELLRHGGLEVRGGGVRIVDDGVREKALASLSGERAREVRQRCAGALRDAGGGRGNRGYRVELAHLELALARTSEDLSKVLDAAEAECEAGQLFAARRLCTAVAEHSLASGEVRERLSVVRSRLDLAQSRSSDALDELGATFGSSMETWPIDAALVGAEAAETAGQRERARAAYDALLGRAPTREQELRGRVGRAHGIFLDGAVEDALAKLDFELHPSDPCAPAVGCLNLRAACFARLGRYSEGERAMESAFRRARQADDAQSLARAHLHLAYLDRRRGRPRDALGALEETERIARAAGHPRLLALACNNHGVLRRDQGDLARAIELFLESLRLRRRIGDAHGAASSLGNLALAYIDAGQAGAAFEVLDQARELLDAGAYRAEAAVLERYRALALAVSGRSAEARALVPSGKADTDPLAGRTLALVAIADGRGEQALELLARARSCALEGHDVAEAFRVASCELALGRDRGAAAAELRRLADELGSPVRAAECAWRAADRPVASSQLEGWLDTFEQCGRTDLVRAAALELSVLLDAEGRVEDRRRAMARARAAADALLTGVRAPDAERLLELSRKLGGGPAPGAPSSALDVNWFLDWTHRLAVEEDLRGLVETVVDMALEITGGQRGFLLLVRDGRVEVEIARGAEPGQNGQDASFSRTLIHEAIRSGEAVVTTNASHDGRFAGAASIRDLKLRSVVCVPLPEVTGLRGGLYVDNREEADVFDGLDVERLTVLADQAAIAITHWERRRQIEVLNARLEDRVEHQAVELERTRELLRQDERRTPVADLVGESAAMMRLYELIRRLAPTELPVLISGPSGAGKDLVSRALHSLSGRASGPFVAENVAALPAALLESELFGHVRGAYTGATEDHEGLFARAEGGTFFLDEIGDMPRELQAKLLRVLETGDYRRVGSAESTKSNARIVAATNKDLRRLVEGGAFREDLYYRLNAAEIVVPSLSERAEDVPLLAEHFVRALNEKHGTRKTLAREVVLALQRRSWPGEVRELANEVARVFFLSEEAIDDADLVRSSHAIQSIPASLQLADAERAAIERALQATGGRKDQAARLLGISRSGLYTKLRRLGLE